MADEKKPSFKSVESDVVALNSLLRQTMKREEMALSGDSFDRTEEILRLHNQYTNMIQSDSQNLYTNKSPSQNTYDYIVNSLIGANGENLGNKASLTGNPERDKWVNRSKLEKLFTMGDSTMLSYFLATNTDIMHIYDEIDSVCAYFYQLEEAVDCHRDNIFSAERPGVDLNCDIKFNNISDDTSQIDYVEQVKEALKYDNFTKKLRDFIGPKTVKYGCYYVMIIPFKEVGARLAEINAENPGMMGGNRLIYESIDVDTNSKDSKIDKNNIVEGCKTLLESLVPDENDKDIDELIENKINIISENLDSFFVCEDTTPPNINGLKLSFGMSEETKKIVEDAIKKHANEVNKGFKFVNPNAKDNTIDDKSIEEIQGCTLQLVDPRQMFPIRPFENFTLGYYYFENYDFARMGTTLTDIMSNQMNFTQRTMVIDNIVNAILKNLKYKDLIEGNQELRTMILNCVLYAERRNNPIRVKFVPSDYVVSFQTNTDQNGNGQPVLLRALFYARLYTSLLLFNMATIITKSTDSEFYYLRESALDAQYSNNVSDMIDQFQDNNVDLVSIANGNILHGNQAINKRYFMSYGTSDQRPVDMEIVSGQQVDIHNEFMNDLKKMAIGATGVPAVMIDFMDEVEYATMLGMANIRFQKRCNMIAADFDGPITECIKRILRYNSSSIPDNVLESLEITLRKSNTLSNNITSQQLNDVISTATSMVEQFIMGQETNPGEDQGFIKEEMIRELVMRMCSGAPWEYMQEIYDNSVIKGANRRMRYKATEIKLNSGTE